MIGKIKKWLCCAYAVLRKGVYNMILAAKAALSGESAKVKKKKSPLRFLLNPPGGSTREAAIKKMLTIRSIGIFSLGMLTVPAVVMIALWLENPNLGALLILLMGFLGALLTLILIYAWDDEIDDYLLGSRGESRVALYLDRLGRRDWRVFHDFQIPGKKQNIDHIVVCPKDVFCFETKAPRVISGKSEKLRFDGEKIYKGDFALEEPDPVKQAKGNAADLSDFIFRETGISIFVMPIVTFPDWEVNSEKKPEKIIVTNPKLLWYLEKLPDNAKLSREAISKIADAIESDNKFRLDE